jgi:hypothetical protein
MDNGTCNADGCETLRGKHGAKGYCSKHYKRLRANGLADKVTRPQPGSTPVQSLEFHGWVITANGCHEFKGPRSSDGYGKITVDRKPYRAHRASYEAWVGAIPEGQLIRHTCDNPICINPEHLIPGTPKENTGDAVARQRVANGERSGQHKLTDTEVALMRSLYGAGKYTQRGLAKYFGCSQAQVSNILLAKQRVNETFKAA